MAETLDSRNGGGLQDLALTWSGRALDVSRIEAELGKLRYMAAGEPASGQGFALRTSLLNMVVYAEHEEGGLMASRVIEELASYHPSRALVVIANAAAEESLIEAQLAAHCHISRSEEQSVCCEEVTLRVGGPGGAPSAQRDRAAAGAGSAGLHLVDRAAAGRYAPLPRADGDVRPRDRGLR